MIFPIQKIFIIVQSLLVRMLTSVLVDPVDKEVHGSCFCHLMILPKQPQTLTTAQFICLTLNMYSGGVVAGTLNCCQFEHLSLFSISRNYFRLSSSGMPPGNDKIRGTLSTADNFVPKKTKT